MSGIYNDALVDFLSFSMDTTLDVSYEREAGRTDLCGPQEMATQARQASR